MSFITYLNERSNAHLIKAKSTKDDEFYTTYDHAASMITPFAKHFRGKSILCNCDAPDKSQVFEFMRDNFDKFGMKKLVGVGYKSFMQIVTKDDIQDIQIKNDGDFRTGESLDALKECDVVVSNPPFSDNMFIDFITLALDNNKDLLAIGPLDGAKAKNVKPYLIDEKLFAIKSPYQDFKRPNDAKSSATQVKVAVFTTFNEDPFGKELDLSNDIDILTLPTESKLMVPVSISRDGKFSIKTIPSDPSGDVNMIVVPLHVLRTNWRKHFKIVDILNTVHCNGKKLMSGILMKYI